MDAPTPTHQHNFPHHGPNAMCKCGVRQYDYLFNLRAPAPAVSGQTPDTLLEEADKWVADSGHWTKSDPHRCASNIILELATALRAALQSAPVASARTVTRYKTKMYLHGSSNGPGIATLEEVVLASEVDPLLSALADLESKMIERDKWLDDFERIDVARNDELVTLRALLAERAQEIERLKGAAESDAEEYIKAVQVVGEMTEQIHALTARA